MAEPIISVSGLRGVVGESLTPHVVTRYVAAFAAELPPGAVVVARDGRTTGGMVAEFVRGTLCAAGRPVIDAGIAATPTVGVLVRSHGAVGGIQISASHNPPPYNGLKLFSGEGRVLTASAGEPVLERYRAASSNWVAFDKIGGETPAANPHAEHLKLVLATVNVPAIQACRFRVLLDSNHGSGSLLGKMLLAELGCQVTLLGDVPDGRFAHPPEPTAENLREVAARVQLAGAQVGFCQDPDADRLALIDEQGRYIGEEYTLALCVAHRLRQQAGPIVINGSTSRMSDDLAAKFGVRCVRSAVGEANVVERMLATNAAYGGEGNGGPIDPRVGYVRDSFVGMAQVLDLMAARKCSLSELAGELPRYEIVKAKADVDRNRLAAALAAIERRFPDATAEHGDGLRLAWPKAWLQVRGSNTEPIVRVIAEAASRDEAQALCDAALAAIA